MLAKCSASVSDDAKVNFKAKGAACGDVADGYFANKCSTGSLRYYACTDHKSALLAACGLDEKKWVEIKR